MRGAGRGTGVQKTPFAVAASSCQSTILPRAVHRGVLRRVRMASPVVIAFHKPRGLTVEQASAPTHGEVCANIRHTLRARCSLSHAPVSSTSRRQGGRRRTLNDYLSELTAEHAPLGRLSAVGRLDKDTTGLLLLTDDGALSARILEPGRCTKVYEATIKLRAPSKCEGHQLQSLCEGLDLADGFARAQSATLVAEWTEVPDCTRLSSGPRNAKRAAKLVAKQARRRAEAVILAEAEHATEAAACSSVAAGAAHGMDGADAAAGTSHGGEAARAGAALLPLNVCVVRVSMRVGRNRIVRRLLGAVGLPCFELKRVAVGPLMLHDADCTHTASGSDAQPPDATPDATPDAAPDAASQAGPHALPARAMAGPGMISLGLDMPGTTCRLTSAQVDALRKACLPAALSGPSEAVDGTIHGQGQ